MLDTILNQNSNFVALIDYIVFQYHIYYNITLEKKYV